MPLPEEEVVGVSQSCTHSTLSQDTGEPLAGADSSKDLPNPNHRHCPALTLPEVPFSSREKKSWDWGGMGTSRKSSRNCHYHHHSCQSCKVPTSTFTMQGPTLTAPSALEHGSAAHAPSFLPWHWVAAAPNTHPRGKQTCRARPKYSLSQCVHNKRKNFHHQHPALPGEGHGWRWAVTSLPEANNPGRIPIPDPILTAFSGLVFF